MILGTGTDIVEISRIKDLCGNTRFMEKMFTFKEREYLKQKGPESTAGYFCAKEATSKALGTGFSGFKFTDIEIIKKEGVPLILLHGNAFNIACSMGIKEIHISISHCRNYATAIAIAEGKEELITTGNIDLCKIAKEEYPMSIFKVRAKDGHKGDYGKIGIIGGSDQMSGALVLAARAAFRSGAGLVTCVIPKAILDRVGSLIIEATYIVCKDKAGFIDLTNEELDKVIQSCDVLGFGVGIGRTEEIKNALKYIIEHCPKPLVIDADGLFALAELKACLKRAEGKIILTPHRGEMARLLGCDISYVNKNPLEAAENFAKEFNCIVLLKGANTIVTDGAKSYINKTGNPGMASGGSGDVLTGIISSFIGQGYEVFDAAALGAYLHGLAGDNAYKRYGYGLTARDIIDFLGICLKG
jgi:hydroxyethylthiazole kinase-like uncharacterized protein yjeF